MPSPGSPVVVGTFDHFYLTMIRVGDDNICEGSSYVDTDEEHSIHLRARVSYVKRLSSNISFCTGLTRRPETELEKNSYSFPYKYLYKITATIACS